MIVCEKKKTHTNKHDKNKASVHHMQQMLIHKL